MDGLTRGLHAGIDVGGTTFKCAVADGQGEIMARRRVPVTTPGETLAACASFFREAAPGGLKSFGIASFGPVDVDPASPAYGTILNTPKPGWSQVDLASYFRDAFGLPIAVDTDVNGALLAEMRHGAAQGCGSAAYVTIGTGIGAGIFLNGDMAGRPLHPEFGHIPVRRHVRDEGFAGTCPFHGDCLEGMASVTAIRARFGPPEDLPEEDAAWEVIADYLAQACRVLSLSFRPERIVLGGGLMLAPHLLARVQAAYTVQMAGYLGNEEAGRLITTPGLGDDAGLTGAILLGQLRI